KATCWFRPKLPKKGGEGSTVEFFQRFISLIENSGLCHVLARITSACWLSILSFSEIKRRLFCKNIVSASCFEILSVSSACDCKPKFIQTYNKMIRFILQQLVSQK